MRWLLLVGIIALATVARAEEEVVQDEELDLLESIDEDSRIDVARMLSNLFEFNDEDDIEHDEEVGINREARAKGEESAVEQRAAIEPKDQARYNKFVDTFFRRLNADARSTIDPLEVPLVTRKAKKGAAKKGDAKKGKKGDEKKGSRKNNKTNKKKGGNKNGSNKNTNNNNKKKGRHPKNLNLDEVEVENESDGVVAVAEEEVHHVVTRDAEHVEEIEEKDDDEDEVLDRHVRSLEAVDEDEDDVDSAAAVSRRIKLKGNKNKNNTKKNNGNKKKGKSNKGKNGGKGKGKNKKNSNKSKRSANKKNEKARKGKKRSGHKTSRASVSGIASLTRIGDVTVVNRKDGKELRTEFKIGPITLKVNRSFGKGKDAVVRSATAESPELTGKMHLSVAANGKAKITKFNISRPSVVTTSGTLNKDGARSDNNFMEKSIARITPMAAKKLKLAARDVLQKTESKN